MNGFVMFDLFFNFNGRISRLPYLLSTLSIWAIFFILIFLVQNVSITYAGVLICLYYISAIQIKRWHDIGLSGWFVLLGFVPLIGLFVGLYCLFKSGEAGANKYSVDFKDL